MNIVIKMKELLCKETQYNLQNNIHFLDSKTNNIMVGEFTKLIFTNENMTLNGLYLISDLCFSHEKRDNESRGKQLIPFQCNHLQNISVIHDFIQIERKLLDLYMEYKQCGKRPKFVLQQQLMNESIQLYYEPSFYRSNTTVLKISGIWETDTSYGITYKFIQM